MTGTKLALVCDDRPERADRWKKKLTSHLDRDAWTVQTVTGVDLAALVDALAEREQRSRDVTAPAPAGRRQEMLDQLDTAELVLLDSDLSPSPQELLNYPGADPEAVGRSLRNQYGDSIAQQVRTYTEAGFIAVANMFVARDSKPKTFDLTLMQGAYSNADFHVGSEELGEAGLWSGKPSRSGVYNPWSQPAMATADEWVRRSEAAISDVDALVLPTLRLSSSALSTRQLDIFRTDPELVTFRGLVESRIGFKYPDADHDDQAVVRMAASVTRRWVNRILLPAQETISDAPHLVARFPQLLGDAGAEKDAWDLTVMKTWEPVPALKRIEAAVADQFRPFTDRTVYDVEKVRELLPKLPTPSVPALRLCFLEDRSAFVPREDAKQFETDVPGTYVRRFVAAKRHASIAYEPFTRLLT